MSETNLPPGANNDLLADQAAPMTREQLVESLIAQGKAVFSDPLPNGWPRYNVLRWLLGHCMEHTVALNPWDADQVVEAVHAHANQVISHGAHHLLTADRLRELLNNVPENTPIFLERLPDSLFSNPSNGWKTTPLSSSSQLIDDELQSHIDAGRIGPHRIDEREGSRFLVETAEAVGAFNASVETDAEGRKAVFLTPHY